MSAEALAKGLTGLKPARSQVVLLALAIGGIWLIWQGGVLLAEDKAGGWLVGPGCLLTLAVVVGWFRSQPDVDLDRATKTQLDLPDGTLLTTDSRVLRDKGGTENLATILGALAERQTLPPPAGLIDPNGQIIPNSAEAAQVQVAAINQEVEGWKLNAAARLPEALAGAAIVQPPPLAPGAEPPEPPNEAALAKSA